MLTHLLDPRGPGDPQSPSFPDKLSPAEPIRASGFIILVKHIQLKEFMMRILKYFQISVCPLK